MSDDWCDDDRAPLRTTSRCSLPTSVPDIPVWKVLKEMYDEEKQQLASHVSQRKLPQIKFRSSSDAESDYFTEIDQNIPSDENLSEKKPKEEETVNSHIMDEIIYKKFSYL